MNNGQRSKYSSSPTFDNNKNKFNLFKRNKANNSELPQGTPLNVNEVPNIPANPPQVIQYNQYGQPVFVAPQNIPQGNPQNVGMPPLQAPFVNSYSANQNIPQQAIGNNNYIPPQQRPLGNFINNPQQPNVNNNFAPNIPQNNIPNQYSYPQPNTGFVPLQSNKQGSSNFGSANPYKPPQFASQQPTIQQNPFIHANGNPHGIPNQGVPQFNTSGSGGNVPPKPPKLPNSDGLFKGILKKLANWFKKPNSIIVFMLCFVLPMLFLACLVSPILILKVLFLIGAISAIYWLVWKKPFNDGVRLTGSVTYAALIIIIVINMITGVQPQTINSPAQSSNMPEQQATATPEPETSVAFSEDLSDESIGIKSEAQVQCELFMNYWMVMRVEDMSQLVAPTWAQQQTSATQALFTLLANRVPVDYEITDTIGNDNDTSQTIILNATINKYTDPEPSVYSYQVLMLKENGMWYIDPSSLATNIVETTPDPNVTPTPTEAPRETVTPVPDGRTKLYYNSEGGSYYHIDPECESVNKKYLPLDSFYYEQLDEAPYNELKPCLKCGAPSAPTE